MRRQYRFLGLNLAISGTEPVMEALRARLRYFPEVDGTPDIRFEFVKCAYGDSDPVLRPSGRSRPLKPSPDSGFEVVYFPDRDQMYLRYGERVSALCDVAAATVRVSIRDPESENLWTATHPVFVVPLFEILKRRGYFNVHAAAMAVGDRALLIAGHSAAGKSTLVVALSRAGFGFMSDDYVFLTRAGKQLKTIGFAEELDLMDGTLAMFPELAGMRDVGRRPGWAKRQLRVEDYWAVPFVEEGAPSVLIFPAVHDAPTSTLEPIASHDAVAALVPNIQFTEATTAQVHLDLLGELVDRCACYRLSTGRDSDVLPMRLRALLEGRHPADRPQQLGPRRLSR